MRLEPAAEVAAARPLPVERRRVAKAAPVEVDPADTPAAVVMVLVEARAEDRAAAHPVAAEETAWAAASPAVAAVAAPQAEAVPEEKGREVVLEQAREMRVAPVAEVARTPVLALADRLAGTPAETV